MSDKFRNKYRIPSARLQNWDYGSNALYFVTICTHHRECYFGEIENGNMVLSEIGEIAKLYWFEMPNHFPFAKLGEFVMMPNHLHGILIIDKSTNEFNNANGDVIVETPKLVVETPKLGVSTATTAAKNRKQTINASQKWRSGSLGVIMNQYKRVVTLNARKIHADFAWQSRFHDHIIRNDESFHRISEYIKNNPLKWADDEFYDGTL